MSDGRGKTGDPALTPAPGAPPAPVAPPLKARFFGVDAARGVALISMLGANVYIDNALNDNGTPTIAAMTVTGRSATMFVMVAGISLAFLSGGRHPVHGRNRRAASAAIAVRALLIAAIGLALGWPDANLVVILPYYGLFFLLAIPLLGLRPRVLACIAGALIVVGPLIRLAAFSAGLRDTFNGNPTLTAPFFHLSSFLLELLVTGAFPAVVYMAYICAGLAIGRLDLTSTKVAVRLLAGGLALAVTAWVASTFILFHLGGLQHLHAAAASESDPSQVTNDILWQPDQVASWWWLALRAPHSTTPFDALHTLGSAMAALGAVLLLSRLRIVRRLLWPVAVAGAMTLTIYSAHILILWSGVLSDHLFVLYLLLVAAALTFAVIWHRLRGQGPLERFVAMAAGRVRRAVAGRPPGHGANAADPSAPAAPDTQPARNVEPGPGPAVSPVLPAAPRQAHMRRRQDPLAQREVPAVSRPRAGRRSASPGPGPARSR